MSNSGSRKWVPHPGNPDWTLNSVLRSNRAARAQARSAAQAGTHASQSRQSCSCRDKCKCGERNGTTSWATSPVRVKSHAAERRETSGVSTQAAAAAPNVCRRDNLRSGRRRPPKDGGTRDGTGASPAPTPRGGRCARPSRAAGRRWWRGPVSADLAPGRGVRPSRRREGVVKTLF